MIEPLNSFAERIIRNGEVATFIRGLIEKGVDPKEIKAATEPVPVDPWKEAGRYRMEG